MSPNSHPPIGKLINVGSHRLHIYPTGEGSPTVVLESGGASGSLDWNLVQTEVAKFTRVCSYDRAGFGWSDSGPKPRTSQQIVTELHTLLTMTEIKPPYILVGHSFGGHTARLAHWDLPWKCHKSAGQPPCWTRPAVRVMLTLARPWPN